MAINLIETQTQAQVSTLIFNKTPTVILIEYSNYSNVLSAENAAKLLEHIRISNYAIKLEKDKQLFFGPIYSLKPIELEILKIYIKTNLVNGCIWPSKSFTEILIFFIKSLIEIYAIM